MSPAFHGRILTVARKELLHILRDPMTLFFTLFIPVMQMFLLGFAIDHHQRIQSDRAVVDERATVQLGEVDAALHPGADDRSRLVEVAADAEIPRQMVQRAERENAEGGPAVGHRGRRCCSTPTRARPTSSSPA